MRAYSLNWSFELLIQLVFLEKIKVTCTIKQSLTVSGPLWCRHGNWFVCHWAPSCSFLFWTSSRSSCKTKLLRFLLLLEIAGLFVQQIFNLQRCYFAWLILPFPTPDRLMDRLICYIDSLVVNTLLLRHASGFEFFSFLCTKANHKT